MNSLHFPTTRWGAATTHVGFSAILLLIIMSLVYFVWYPGALTFAGGAEEGLKIVIAVDMVLGPLLTLVVYNIVKPRKELIRDLSFIALFQISCLVAGMSLVYEQRPLAVVYSGNEFQIFDAQDLENNQIQINLLDKFSGPYPKIILEKAPEDPDLAIQYQIENIPLFGQKIHHEYWESFPMDEESLSQVFANDSINDCITRSINSFNVKGDICFNAQTLAFSNFQKQ